MDFYCLRINNFYFIYVLKRFRNNHDYPDNPFNFSMSVQIGIATD